MSSKKGVLFSWLAAVHAQPQSRLAKLPESPALAELLHIKHEFNWSDQCYREVKLLGEASGLHFKDYVRNLPDVIGRPGDCVMNPIILDKVKRKKVCSPEEIAPTVIEKTRASAVLLVLAFFHMTPRPGDGHCQVPTVKLTSGGIIFLYLFQWIACKSL
ncbi:hypothetical protein M758_2G144300 [Ceratodon purpureus]|nr:hypothetical protein M758_2G144300 [Ceratodon purpureus]